MTSVEPAWLRYMGESIKYAPPYEPRVRECVDNGEGVSYVIVGYDDGLGCYDRSGRFVFGMSIPPLTTPDSLRCFAKAILRNCSGFSGGRWRDDMEVPV